jgi:hypothetical protein
MYVMYIISRSAFVGKYTGTFYVLYLFSARRAVFEVMWKNRVDSDRPQATIWGMRFT